MSHISKLDKNFVTENKFLCDDLVWIPATEEYFSLFGLRHTKDGYIRMDLDFARSVNENIGLLATHTCGGRLVFETDSPFIAIKTEGENQSGTHMTMAGSSGFDLYIEKDGEFRFFNIFPPEYGYRDGYQAIRRFKEHKLSKYMIHFPLYNEVKKLYIGLKKDSVLNKYDPYIKDKPIVIYGSSITQGASASHPGNCYPAILSRMLKRDFLCFGFSGNARGEVEMAEYIASLPMSAFIYDYDHNEVFFPELFKEKHPRFYNIIREAHKDIPIIFMSAPYTPRAEGTLEKTRPTVIDNYEKAKARGEKVCFVDGKTIYGERFYDCGTVDGAHPTDFGFVMMADAVHNAFLKVM